MASPIPDNIAFATALAVLAAAMHLLFSLAALVSPNLFRLLFNAQFFGARVASLLPRETSVGEFIGTAVVLVASAWLFGAVWAWLYNRFAR